MDLSVTTYNILFDTRDDELPEIHRWPNRKGRLIQAIRALDSDIVCVQEMTPNQRRALVMEIGHIYTCFGTNHRMINGILFKKNRFTPIDSAVIPTGKYNHISYLKLRDLKEGKNLIILNTHLNFSSEQLRAAQAAIIHALAAALLLGDPSTQLIVTGDMNTFPNRPELSLPFYDGDKILETIQGNLLRDSREISQSPPLGPASSFTNKGPGDTRPFEGTGVEGVILDHIFVSPGVEVTSSKVSPMKIDGEFPSDHMPLTALVNIP